MTRELFHITELVRLAVEDERTGVAFYSAVAERIQKPALRQVFLRLAEDEKHHQKRFEMMLESLGDYKPREQYLGEYMEYLRTLTTERAFPDEDAALRQARACESDGQAIDLASRFERDTLVLMNEMSSLVPERDQVVVRELTREEQGHLVALSEARKQL